MPDHDHWVATERFYTPTLTLTPPMSENFHVYGNEEVQERVTTWAFQHRYWRVGGVPDCPHGLYGMDMCPTDCYGRTFMDHVSMWFQSGTSDDTRPRLFLLSHPYLSEVPDEAGEFARAHGLRLSSYEFDEWYAPGHTIPIRLSADSTNILWPIETRLLVLSTLLPAPWEKYEKDFDYDEDIEHQIMQALKGQS